MFGSHQGGRETIPSPPKGWSDGGLGDTGVVGRRGLGVCVSLGSSALL